MDKFERFTKKYTQAPWRNEMQFIGVFSLALVLAALVAGLYLSVSARVTAVGREIQSMQRTIEALDRQIEDTQSRLAILTSASEMEKRAKSLGFEPIQPDQVMYLPVPEFAERPSPVLAPYTEPPIVSAPVIPPEYTESIFDWLSRQSGQIATSLMGVQR